MSMTAEERKAWAHERLTTYLRDVEVSEFMDQLADVTHLEDRVCDLEGAQEGLSVRVETLEDETDRLDDRIDALREEVEERLEGDVA